MFTDTAIWEMPPFTGWYQGPEVIGSLIAHNCPAEEADDMLLLPATANGQPAFGLYMRDADDVDRPFQLQVLDITGGSVATWSHSSPRRRKPTSPDSDYPQSRRCPGPGVGGRNLGGVSTRGAAGTDAARSVELSDGRWTVGFACDHQSADDAEPLTATHWLER